MEEFYHKLLAHYPQAPLPPLPRKVLFVGETDIRERRAVFHRIVRCIAQDANLATSPELLEFLGNSEMGLENELPLILLPPRTPCWASERF